MSDYENEIVKDCELTSMLRKNNEENSAHFEAMEKIHEESWDGLYTDLVSKLAADNPTAVSQFYEAGLLLVDYHAQHGDRGLSQLLKTLSATKKLSEKKLKASFKFAKEFELSDVRLIESLYNQELDYRVNQTHLLRVMSTLIHSPEQRIEYLKRVVNEGISPDNLAKIIAKELGTGGTGAQFKNLSGPDEVLVSMQERLQKFLKWDKEVLERDMDPALLLLSSETARVNETTRGELQNTIEMLEEMKAACERIRPFLVSLYPKYTEVMARNNAGAAHREVQEEHVQERILE